MARGKILGFPTSYVVIALLICAYIYVPAFGVAVNDLLGSLKGSLGLSGISTVGTYQGNVQLIENIQDKILGTAVDPTADTYRVFYNQPTTGAGGIVLTTTGTTVTAPAQGYVWLAINGGSDYFFCEDYFNILNSAFVISGSGYWADLEDDNTPDYVVKIDTSKAGVTGQTQTPNINLIIPELHEDMTLAVGSAPADQAAVGAAETVVSITYGLNGITANDGFFVTRVYFTVNTTIAGGQVAFEEMSWSGGLCASSGAQTFWSAPAKTVEGSTSYWYYILGDPTYKEYPNGERLWYKSASEADTMYMTIKVRCKLVDGMAITMYLDATDGGGTQQAQLTDAMTLNHG